MQVCTGGERHPASCVRSHLYYLFILLSYGVLSFFCRNLITFIQIGFVCQKWLFFSNEIKFVMKYVFFALKCFSEPKLAKTLLILIKQTLYFSVISYFEKKLVQRSTEIYLINYFTLIFTELVLCYCCCYCCSSFLTKTQKHS